jgi:hypothetical protein
MENESKELLLPTVVGDFTSNIHFTLCMTGDIGLHLNTVKLVIVGHYWFNANTDNINR